jgi:hypothetical protein
MTQEQLLAAINASGLTADELTLVLSFAAALVSREKIRAAMAKERSAQSLAHNESEAKVQALQAQFDAIETQLAAQA